MEEAKKPKRPRIGAAAAAIANESVDNEARYEKVNYPTPENQSDDERSSDESFRRPYQRPYTNYQQRPQQSTYQQRRPYQPQNRPGGYQNRNMQGGYQRNNQNYHSVVQENADTQDSNATQTRPQTGYQRQGGYQNRNMQQGGYQRQGGYQNRNMQNGYQRQGGYQNRNQQGGYQRQGGYQNRNQQSGYQRQGGYQTRNMQQGGYQRQGGYMNRNQQGGYQQGGYQNRIQGGYQRPSTIQNRKYTPRPKQVDYVLEDIDPNAEIRLNKYIANAGLCSRREADEYITSGKVKVNGNVVTELGTKITRNDVVECDEKVVTPERKCYVLLNKPKDCVTTSDDPHGRTTVLDIVHSACTERIYPVGRLDRNTTGVLLLTNDGDLASKLTHPKFVKKKIYHVWTDRPISEEDMQRLADGIELEDGEIHADAISYVSEERNQAGIEIHSGRNRIVRRMFEALGYRVTKLDRVYFAGLTKKNLPRGRWRYLTQEEVNFLRMGSFE